MPGPNPQDGAKDGAKATAVPREPDEAALAAMSNQELLALGGKLDGVRIAYKEPRWPVEGTKAEKRAERSVAVWLLLGGVFGLALLLIFLFWPWEFKAADGESDFIYSLTTPLYGLTFGLSILSIAIGAVLYQKRFIPEEISIQERHDGASREIDRKTVVANLTDAFEGSTIRRRKLIGLSFGVGMGAFGLGTLVAFAGGLIKNPWKPVVPTAEGKKAVLWTSGWTPATRARRSIWRAPPARRTDHRSSKCARRIWTPVEWRPFFPGGSPTATAPPSNHTISCRKSRWVSVTR